MKGRTKITFALTDLDQSKLPEDIIARLKDDPRAKHRVWDLQEAQIQTFFRPRPDLILLMGWL